MSGAGDPELSDEEEDIVPTDASDSKLASSGGGFRLAGPDMGSLKEAGRKIKEEEEASERGESVSIAFKLPSGESVEENVRPLSPSTLNGSCVRIFVPPPQFPVGQTVMFLKFFIQETSGIAVECQVRGARERLAVLCPSLNC